MSKIEIGPDDLVDLDIELSQKEFKELHDTLNSATTKKLFMDAAADMEATIGKGKKPSKSQISMYVVWKHITKVVNKCNDIKETHVFTMHPEDCPCCADEKLTEIISKKPTNPEEAFKLAATLAVTAPSNEQSDLAVKHMEELSGVLSEDVTARICSEVEDELGLEKSPEDPAVGSTKLTVVH